VYSKGTDADETNGPVEGGGEWWNGAKAESITPPYASWWYKDEKSTAFTALHSFILPFDSPIFASSEAKEAVFARRMFVRGSPFWLTNPEIASTAQGQRK